MDDAVIEAIYRYPVKGLSPDRLPVAALTVGQTIRGDRRFAIENGPSGFDPAAPGYLPKQRFLMLMKNERLARLDTRFDDATSVLTVRDGDAETRGDLASGARARSHRNLLRPPLRRRVARAAEGPRSRGPQLLRCGAQGRVDHQSFVRRGARRDDRPRGRSAALSRQPLCARLAGLERARPRRPRHRRRHRAGEGRQAHRALRRDQRRTPSPASAI